VSQEDIDCETKWSAQCENIVKKNAIMFKEIEKAQSVSMLKRGERKWGQPWGSTDNYQLTKDNKLFFK